MINGKEGNEARTGEGPELGERLLRKYFFQKLDNHCVIVRQINSGYHEARSIQKTSDIKEKCNANIYRKADL